MADTVFSPFCVETSGGLGKEAQIVLRELSRVAFPGDAEDPHVRKNRAVWRSLVTKEHAFDLARRRNRIMSRKYDMMFTAFRGKCGPHAGLAHRARVAATLEDVDRRARAVAG